MLGLPYIFRAGTASIPIRSLVVLPLTDVSGRSDQDYLADEITDALRQRLGAIRDLRVISRTSSMHYQGSGRPLPEIARELHVDGIVAGSLSRTADRVSVAIELIRSAADAPAWSGNFDGDLKSVSALQNTAAEAVANEILSMVRPADRAQFSRMRVYNADAYREYSKGRFLWNKRTEEDMKKAILLFQQAVEEDHAYALAWDGLADCWLALGWYGYLSPAEAFPQAKTALSKALSLDDSLAEAHTSLAFFRMYNDFDWAGAEREFRRAIDLNPNYATGHHWYAEFLSLVGRHEEGIAESERARELDPLSSII